LSQASTDAAGLARIVIETSEHPDVVIAFWDKFRAGLGPDADPSAQSIRERGLGLVAHGAPHLLALLMGLDGLVGLQVGLFGPVAISSGNSLWACA
jgi:hypothetical protein